jgi:hypothetical protein
VHAKSQSNNTNYEGRRPILTYLLNYSATLKQLKPHETIKPTTNNSNNTVDTPPPFTNLSINGRVATEIQTY